MQTKEKRLVKKGINNAANLVKVTLGAEGKTVIISDSEGVRTTKDGVTVASHIKYENPYENIGAKMLIEAAEKTASLAGDGTTTTAILVQAIVNRCDELMNPRFPISFLIGKHRSASEITRILKEEMRIVLENLKKQSISISSDTTDNMKKLIDVITVSSNGDAEIVKLISDIIGKIGKNSVISFEESLNNTTYSTILEGMSFEKGFSSHQFVTDKFTNTCVLDKPYILVTDKINSFKTDLFSILKEVSLVNRSLLVICNEITDEALSQVLMNVNQGHVKACVIKAPHFGLRREETIGDIVELVGTTYVCKAKGVDIEDITIDDLGEIESCSIHKEYSVLKTDTSNNVRLQKRVEELKQQIKDTKYDFDIERIEDRLSRLLGGVATIFVGGATEIEMKEKKDRVEDAIRATKSALEEGIVVGGGMAYYRCTLYNTLPVLGKCLIEPLRQIFINGDEEHKNYIHFMNDKNSKWGFNIKTKNFENFIETGIIDSHKVLRVALEHAVSIAISYISSEGIIVEKKPVDDGSTNIVMPNFLGGNK